MKFSMSHKFLSNCPIEEFDENSVPDWLTCCNTIAGSTMDDKWFWENKVLKLSVGEEVETDFRTITRIA